MTLYLQMGPNGRIVIPKQIREILGIKHGSTIVANIFDNTLQLTSVKNSITKAQALVKQYCGDNVNSVDEFLKARKEETIQEEKSLNLDEKYNG